MVSSAGLQEEYLGLLDGEALMLSYVFTISFPVVL